MNDAEHVRRSEQAKAILDSPLWAEAWEAYQRKLVGRLVDCDSEDLEGILSAKRMLLVAKEARTYFEQLIQQGKISAETIKIQDDRKRWFKREER